MSALGEFLAELRAHGVTCLTLQLSAEAPKPAARPSEREATAAAFPLETAPLPAPIGPDGRPMSVEDRILFAHTLGAEDDAGAIP